MGKIGNAIIVIFHLLFSLLYFSINWLDLVRLGYHVALGLVLECPSLFYQPGCPIMKFHFFFIFFVISPIAT